MSEKLDGHTLDQLFRTARTRNGWTDQPVSEAQIRELYDLFKFGPTSGNACPARFVWVTSAAGKQKLSALASDGNKPKILAAPITVIIGHDLEFAEQMLRVPTPYVQWFSVGVVAGAQARATAARSEEHTSELQSQ